MSGLKGIQGSVSFIGAGNMGEALIRGLISSGLLPPENITASDPRGDRLGYLNSKYGINTETDNRKALEKAGIALLAVKPQTIRAVAGEIAPVLNPDMLVISIAAGVNLETLKKGTQTQRVIRVMPNTPALVLQGMSCICQDGALPHDIAVAEEIFRSVGKVMVVEERLIDAVTGLSGSGPAYFFMIIEALADGGVKMGLSRAQALTLAKQTMFGAAALISELGSHPAELKDMVTSPGGTTIWGLHALERGGLRAALIDAVESATNRSKELGKS